jgi:transitional endoplasmic reticulum ATPase
MEELKLMRGDQVLLRGKQSIINQHFYLGKKRKETVCIAFTSEDPLTKDDQIKINKGTRKNLRVRLGDVVIITAIPELPNAT